MQLRMMALCLSLAAPLAAVAEPASGTIALAFVSCPVYRDVDRGPKSGCWLADDPATGLRYDVSLGRSKPYLGRLLLVEGIRATAPDACGGVVLQPVRVSVLADSCPAHLLPAEDLPGRPFELPAEVMQPTDVPRAVPQPPYTERTFLVYFDFDSDFPIYQYSELILERAALYARASGARHVAVTGFAATRPRRVSGLTLAEAPAIARARAERIALALSRLGVPDSSLVVRWQGRAGTVPGGDEGLLEPSRRRVAITIRP